MKALPWTLALLAPAIAAQQHVGEVNEPALGAGAELGGAVDMESFLAVLGASRAESLRGSALLAQRSGSTWSALQVLEPLDDGLMRFGSDVGVSEAIAVVGAPLRDNGTGSAYVFEVGGDSQYHQFARLEGSDAVSGDQFGSAVAISQEKIVVGSPGDDHSLSTGSIYVYSRNDAGWPLWNLAEDYKIHLTVAYVGSAFGTCLDLEQSSLIVGAPGGSNPSAYVFQDNGSTFAQEDRLEPSDGENSFAAAVAIDGNFAVVGAPLAESENFTGWNVGAVYVYRKTGTDWNEVAKVFAPDESFGMAFGSSLEIDGTRIIVGSNSGAAYLVDRVSDGVGPAWRCVAKMEHQVGEGHGRAVASHGARFLAGAPESDENGTDLGAGDFYEMPIKVTPIGFGDQSDCPCSGEAFFAGCPNSTGSGAKLTAGGSVSVEDDDLLLQATGLVPGQVALLIKGPAQVRLPIGNGLLVAGGGGLGIGRMEVVTADFLGRAGFGPGLVDLSHDLSIEQWIDPDETWIFQAWYRDPLHFGCPGASNLTNAISARFAD